MKKVNISGEMSILRPIVVDDLVRLGRQEDGGYLVQKSIVKISDALVAFGVGSDWSFEQDFNLLNNTCPITAYDHTVSIDYFKKRLYINIIKFILNKASFSNLLCSFKLLKTYKKFFNSSHIKHLQKRIISNKINFNDITIDEIFLNLKQQNIFFKIDIEGSEYRILDDLMKYSSQISGMVIEFHDTDLLRGNFLRLLKRIDESFHLVHLHANNCSAISRDGIPELLELTFSSKRIITDFKLMREILPLDGLDFKNIPAIDDFAISFLEK